MADNRMRRVFSTNLASLRGIAACMVVVFHSLLVFRIPGFDNPHRQSFAETVGWETVTLLSLALVNGHAAVIVFFVLSGVVLTLAYDRQQPGIPALCGFYIKRVARLWPLLAAAAVFALGVRGFVSQRHEPGLFTDWVSAYFAQPVDIGMLARNLLGLASSLNYPAWTIYIELAASLLFPLLFVACRDRTMTLAALALFALLTLTGWNFHGFGQYIVCFLAGIALTRHGAPLGLAFLAWPRWARITTLACTWAVILIFDRFHSPAVHMHQLAVLVFTLGATVIVAHLFYAPRNPFLASRPLLWLGEISYGIYLLHFPVLIGLSHLAAPHLGTLDAGQAVHANLLLALAAFAVTLPLAWLSFVLMERPCQEAGRRIARLIETRRQVRRAAPLVVVRGSTTEPLE